jgi:transketolase
MNLVERSKWVWWETLAIHLLAPETRLASSLSSVEIFVGLYYGGVLNHFPNNPFSKNRDRCIISKGHGSICMYPILADLGYFAKEELKKVCKPGGILGGIPDPIIPGYETVNGSLGHGLGVATGMAFGIARKKGNQDVFVVTGDGELHEGANWEAIMFASQHRLDNLNLVIDNNKISMLGFTSEIIDHNSFVSRFQSFGWNCREVDGHDVLAVTNAMLEMKGERKGAPKVLVANTIKGKGVPGLENQPLAHIINPKPDLLNQLFLSRLKC